MRQVEETLPQDRFCRIHRSYIVSINHIKKFNNKTVNVGDKNLPIRDQYRNILMGKIVTLSPVPRNKQSFSSN